MHHLHACPTSNNNYNASVSVSHTKHTVFANLMLESTTARYTTALLKLKAAQGRSAPGTPRPTSCNRLAWVLGRVGLGYKPWS